MAGLLVLAPIADADDKATLAADMAALYDQAVAAKSVGDTVLAEQLLAQYNVLRDAWGTDFGISNPVAPPVAPAAPSGSTATSSNHAGGGGAITSLTPATTSVINVATGDTYLHDVDVNVNITHTWSGDLDVTLTSPGGTVIELTMGNGGSNSDVFNGTTFDDSAGVPATQETYVDGVASASLQPQGDLSGLRGSDPNGNWTLTVDDQVAGDDGNLASWSLDITTLDAAPTEATTGFASAPGTPTQLNVAVTDTISVGGLGDYLCDVNVTTDITHTWSGDLDILVQSPAGTFALLTNGNGGSNGDVFSGTLWDASATDNATNHAYADGVTAGPLQAEGSLGGFIGEDPNGDWEITVFDGVAGDDGTLNSWGLDITTCIGAAPECFLVIGDAPVNGPFQHTPFWGHNFTTQVGGVNSWYPVLMDDIPSFLLPSPKRRAPKYAAPAGSGSLDDDVGQGFTQPTPINYDEYFVQVLMWNPMVFPTMPEQYTNGLAVRIFSDGRVLTVPYGDSVGGMTVWSEIFVGQDGKRYIQFPFDVPLM